MTYSYLGGLHWAIASLCCGALSIAAAQDQSRLPAPGNAGPPTSAPVYMLPSQVDWQPLLPPPPMAGTPEQDRDLRDVLDMQSGNRDNAARRAQAIEDSVGGCFRFSDVLGSSFDEKRLPQTAVFLKQATSDGSRAANSVKDYWMRPRPYVVSDQVEKLADADPEYVRQQQERQAAAAKQQAANGAAAGSAKPARSAMKSPADIAAEKAQAAAIQLQKDNTSFPSGHATNGTLCSILLTRMLPERQAELTARAETYRASRMIVGAHFRTDIDAGKLLATAAAAVMSQSFAFQRDEAAARSELRAALGLPAALPQHQADKASRPLH